MLRDKLIDTAFNLGIDEQLRSVRAALFLDTNMIGPKAKIYVSFLILY